MKKSSRDITLSDQQLEKELKRMASKRKRRAVILRTISSILVFSALVLIATIIWFPVYRVADASMEPDLKEGQIVIAMRTQKLKQNDIAAFFYENQILIKRVVGIAGDRIRIGAENPVSGATAPTDLYQVPDGSVAMGDNQLSLMNYGMSESGCVPEEKLAGKIIFCIWPLQYAGYVG